MIFVILGESFSGKSTLLNEFEAAGSKRVLSSATRAPREGEVGTYKFISQDEFKAKIESGEMIEHVMYGGEYYGLCADDIDGENSVLLMEPNGFRHLRTLYPDKVFSIYVNVAYDERKRRALEVGYSLEEIEARQRADSELFTPEFMYEVDCVFNTPDMDDYAVIASMCRTMKSKK